MGLVKVGDKVYNKYFGEGVIKKLLSKTSAAVEFNKFMDGHDCCGYCKRGHGWYCFIYPKSKAIQIDDDDCVYLIKGVKVGEWD